MLFLYRSINNTQGNRTHTNTYALSIANKRNPLIQTFFHSGWLRPVLCFSAYFFFSFFFSGAIFAPEQAIMPWPWRFLLVQWQRQLMSSNEWRENNIIFGFIYSNNWTSRWNRKIDQQSLADHKWSEGFVTRTGNCLENAWCIGRSLCTFPMEQTASTDGLFLAGQYSIDFGTKRQTSKSKKPLGKADLDEYILVFWQSENDCEKK